MRIVHIVTTLDLGGAQVMLYRLLQARDRADTHEVISLADVGPIGDKIAKLGIDPRGLHMTRVPNPAKVLELARMIAALRPDVVQTWMYHADLIGGVAARFARAPRVVWGIHNSTLDRVTARRTTHLVVAASAAVSRWVPDAIVSVSEAAASLHASKGYAASKFVVIPNGFDLAEFRADDAVRAEVRRELGVADDDVLIGMVARICAQKDPANFIRAAVHLAARRPEVRFLLCGGPGEGGAMGATPDNPELVGPLREAGLLDRFLLLGQRDDVPRVVRALDIAALSSAYGEAFPLVIGEAMACEVPCVATDVGDSALLIGDTGRVVPPRDALALAAAWESLVDAGRDGRRRLGQRARARIEERYALPRIAARYQAVWRGGAEVHGAPLEPAAR